MTLFLAALVALLVGMIVLMLRHKDDAPPSNPAPPRTAVPRPPVEPAPAPIPQAAALAPATAPEQPPDFAQLAPYAFRELVLPFVVVDLETTGLSSDRDQITEIGAVVCDDLSFESTRFHYTFESFERLCRLRPGTRIPKRVQDLNGITGAMLRQHGVPLEDALRDLAEFIGDRQLVSFNAGFDLAFLSAASAATGVQLPRRAVCALALARDAYPFLDNHRLATVAELLKLDLSGPHRGLQDAQRTATLTLHAMLHMTRENRLQTLSAYMRGPGDR